MRQREITGCLWRMPTMSLGNCAHLNQVPKIHFAILRTAPNMRISLAQTAVHLVCYILMACISRDIRGRWYQMWMKRTFLPYRTARFSPAAHLVQLQFSWVPWYMGNNIRWESQCLLLIYLEKNLCDLIRNLRRNKWAGSAELSTIGWYAPCILPWQQQGCCIYYSLSQHLACVLVQQA